jgi:glycosyltransferase involved in cell wall biosynthesis
MKPQISIVLPVYNQAHFLAEALNSIYAQTCQDFELIVVNDGSTDDTACVVADYQQRYAFTAINQTNQGLPRALNAGFQHASGEYLTWTSADNILQPNMLDVLSSALERDPAVGLVYADRYLITDDGANLGRFNLPDYDAHLLLHVNLVHCCFLYRRACMERVGLYNPEFIYGEDWEYWIRISRHYRMKRVPAALYRYRLHKTSMTSDLVRGTARSIGYREFSKRIRRRAPMQWYIGKAKWWWLRLTNPQHPAFAGRASWMKAAARAAGQAHLSVLCWVTSLAMSASGVGLLSSSI